MNHLASSSPGKSTQQHISQCVTGNLCDQNAFQTGKKLSEIQIFRQLSLMLRSCSHLRRSTSQSFLAVQSAVRVCSGESQSQSRPVLPDVIIRATRLFRWTMPIGRTVNEPCRECSKLTNRARTGASLALKMVDQRSSVVKVSPWRMSPVSNPFLNQRTR